MASLDAGCVQGLTLRVELGFDLALLSKNSQEKIVPSTKRTEPTNAIRP